LEEESIVTFQTTLSAIPQTVVGKKHSQLTSTQTSQARPEAWMKTLSSIYAAPNMGVMPVYLMLSQCFTSIGQYFLSFHSKIQINSTKFIKNSKNWE